MATYEWLRSTGFAQFLPGQAYQFVNEYFLLSSVSAPGEDAELVRFLCDVQVGISIDEAGMFGTHVGWWSSNFFNVGVGRDGPSATPLVLDFGSEDERITGTGTLSLDGVDHDLTNTTYVNARYSLRLGIDARTRRKVLTPGTTPRANVTIENFAGGTTFPEAGTWEVYYTCYARSLWLVP